MSQGFPSGGYSNDQGQQPFAPPTSPGAIAYAPSNWPKVLGILSIVFGGLGVLNHACQVVSSFGGSALFSLIPAGGNPQMDVYKKVMEKNASLMIVGGLLSVVLTGLSVLLVVAGVKTLNRSMLGVKLHIYWAIGKMAISFLAMIPGYLMMQNQFEVMREMGAAGGGGGLPGGFFAAAGIFGVFIGLAFACAYPIFLLIWFQRSAVKAETSRWSA